jgi:hypothetical protein
MSNLRSLAAILYSAIRFSRAAFLRSPLRSKALINTQKMATNMAANTATNRAASMSVPYVQSTPKTRRGKLRRHPAQKHNQRTKWDTTEKDESNGPLSPLSTGSSIKMLGGRQKQAVLLLASLAKQNGVPGIWAPCHHQPLAVR